MGGWSWAIRDDTCPTLVNLHSSCGEADDAVILKSLMSSFSVNPCLPQFPCQEPEIIKPLRTVLFLGIPLHHHPVCVCVHIPRTHPRDFTMSRLGGLDPISDTPNPSPANLQKRGCLVRSLSAKWLGRGKSHQIGRASVSEENNLS